MNQSKMDCHALTDIGQSRSENEDHFLIADLVKAVRIQSTSLSYDDRSEVSGQSHGKVLLVADGMGGHAAGRRASTLAVDATINYMVNRMQWFAFHRQSTGHEEPGPLATDLVSALKYCQRRIQNEAEWNPDKRGMGTTLTVAIIDWPALHVVHAGDSRCYVNHKEQLCQLTRDHTMAQAFVDAGQISEQAAENSPLSNAFWNVVGGPSNALQPEVHHAQLSIGDTLLLCTDGLTKHVTDDELSTVLRKDQTSKQTCIELVEMANARGGSDNVTVIVARFSDKAETPLATETAAMREDRCRSELRGTTGEDRCDCRAHRSWWNHDSAVRRTGSQP